MKRSEILGFDPTVNKVFAFLFEDSLKKLTLFATYSNDGQLERAKDVISMYVLFWSSGMSIEELKNMFETEANAMFPTIKFEAEIFKERT